MRTAHRNMAKGTVNSNCNLIEHKLLCSKHRKIHTTEILDEIFLAVFNRFLTM